MELADVRSEYQATLIDHKLFYAYAGAAKTQFVLGSGNETVIVIHRRKDAWTNTIPVDTDMRLRAGDVVDVTLKFVIHETK